MARTYRNKSYQYWYENPLVKSHQWAEEIVWNDASRVVEDNQYYWRRAEQYYQVEYKPDSPTGRKLLAEAKRDKVHRFKEPGPHWFRNLFEERPLRRQSKREIQRFMANEEYEPMIDPKQRKKIYWT